MISWKWKRIFCEKQMVYLYMDEFCMSRVFCRIVKRNPHLVIEWHGKIKRIFVIKIDSLSVYEWTLHAKGFILFFHDSRKKNNPFKLKQFGFNVYSKRGKKVLVWRFLEKRTSYTNFALISLITYLQMINFILLIY